MPAWRQVLNKRRMIDEYYGFVNSNPQMDTAVDMDMAGIQTSKTTLSIIFNVKYPLLNGMAQTSCSLLVIMQQF